MVNGNSNQRANIQRLLEKLILEEDQFDVHDILPNTVPDPASLNLESDYACPIGEVVMAPDCGENFLNIAFQHVLMHDYKLQISFVDLFSPLFRGKLL